MTQTILPPDFYARSTLHVARDLLGMRLVRILPDGKRLAGRIVETEAYVGVDDLASHGRNKRTPRNAPMWGPPGRAYVYLIYGQYWMFNVVTEPDNHPAAVLIRAIEPLEGLDVMQTARPGRRLLEMTNGPARLALALSINRAFNEVDLTARESGLWIEHDGKIDDSLVRTGPRIGMGQTPEPWYSMPWRWWVGGNLHVSVGSGKKG